MNTSWKDYLAAIMDTGMTQPDIAKAIGRRQSTISDICCGTTTDPHCSLGFALIALGKKRGVKGAPDHRSYERNTKK